MKKQPADKIFTAFYGLSIPPKGKRFSVAIFNFETLKSAEKFRVVYEGQHGVEPIDLKIR
jgi:hypothetical protein